MDDGDRVLKQKYQNIFVVSSLFEYVSQTELVKQILF